MNNNRPLPILITGGGRRIGLAIAWHLINQKQPVIVSYRTHYPAIDGLTRAGALCIQADFSSDDGILAFADKVKESTHGLRAIIHNASAWMAEKPGTPLSDVLACMMQVHVNAPYLLNHALESMLRGHGHAASDIIHFTDYVVEKGSDKHIAYAASKAALDNMTRSFARKLAPEVKVNAIAPSLILFNEGDDAGYRQKALNKSLMKTAPGEKEIIDLIDYLLTSCFVTGRSFAVDGGRHLR
ncbi:dihydromonapterin reductase [Citrobacter amalonaticus]|uniref:Dihydromonapterin reductase n=1 Tax=Citrobacter amalonaticus TaxID=35703 RepID=A0A2S4RQG4_CITAM|nr:dihydromonapterin reductase [Citrobacter amalonaticus]POT57455.1 dihydromonapterin reductase [Citrobacter amalonaticus]POT77018.1 dihydromonapterin reductase [Citrobacter amalonaticus]POU60151.1 dihydromonapterin reductase [Citrobacter amalonaticus]POV06253.1 dihydromonapterin reductase [Citrobacter amalonaticus]